jgi:hypothetical protein
MTASLVKLKRITIAKILRRSSTQVFLRSLGAHSCVSSETPLLSLWICNGIGRTDVCFVLYSTATVQSVSGFV